MSLLLKLQVIFTTVTELNHPVTGKHVFYQILPKNSRRPD